MDQTQLINNYINNLAEQVKAMTLDNIMIKTQLEMANKTIATLNEKITALESSTGATNWEESSFTKEE